MNFDCLSLTNIRRKNIITSTKSCRLKSDFKLKIMKLVE